MRALRSLTIHVIAIALVFGLSGCGGGGGGGGSSTPADRTEFFRAKDVVLKPNVVVLPSDGTVTISGVTDTGLTLTGTVPAITNGTVLVSGQGGGLMRKVTGATPGSGSLVVTTQDAALTDVFASADIEFRKVLDSRYVNKVNTLLPGVTIGTTSSRAASAGFPIHIPKTFVGEQTGNTKVGVELQADGEVGVAVGGTIKITLANGLERLNVTQATVWTGSYSASLLGEAEAKKEIPYATFIYSPIPIGEAGPVPLFILPVLTLQVSAKGSFKGGWKISGDGTGTYTAGLDYTQSPLGSPVSLSNFSAPATGTHTGTLVAANLYGALKVEVSPWQAELTTSLDGVIGPTFKADAPAVAAELKLPLPLSEHKVQLDSDVVLRGKVGGKAGMLGLGFPLFELTAVEKKFPLKHVVFDPGTGEVTVH